MSTIRVTCPSCQKAYKVSEESLGKRSRCKRCKNIFSLAAPNPAASTPEAIPTATIVVTPISSGPTEAVPNAGSEIPTIPVVPVSIAEKPKDSIPVARETIGTAHEKKETNPPVANESVPVATESLPVANVALPVATEQPTPIAASTAKNSSVSPEVGNSPFEDLATRIMTNENAAGHSPTANPLVDVQYATTDYLSINRSFQRIEEHTEVDQNAMKLVTLGGGLMLFGIILFILALLGLNFRTLFIVRFLGMAIGACSGLVGSSMLMFGFRRRKSLAFLFGGVPALLFLLFVIGYVLLTYSGNFGFLTNPRSLFEDKVPGTDFGEAEYIAARNKAADSGIQTPGGRPSSIADAIRARDRRKQAGFDSKSKFAQTPSSQNFRSANSSTIGDSARNGSGERNPFKTAESENARIESDTASGGPHAFSRYSTKKYREILARQQAISGEMLKAFGLSSAGRFPPTFLSESAGTSRGVGTHLVHAEKRPMIGLDWCPYMNGGSLWEIVPVFSRDQTATLIAKPGYAIGGFYVNVERLSVVGVQPIFMKLNRTRLDVRDSYLGPWHGRKPKKGEGEKISSSGGIVYGIWFEKTYNLCALGLIREPSR